MERKYISVFALNRYIKAKMDQDISLQSIYIKGEISNYRPHPSQHLYFTLKDEHSKVNAIMFASQANKLDFQIEDGMQVLIHGYVSVYEPTGQYQLYIKTMQQDGLGNLYLRFERLKKQLEREGLFDSSHKKIIPTFPKNIAVLSAKQGAAVQDVVQTLHARFPFTHVVVFPIPVQGKDAYLKIIQTLQQVDSIGFDTIIIARGGGSIEDLWNFNEEALARCIYDLNTPIISGIGHETDFTICDFVCDYRAVTPTAAAVHATPDRVELKNHLIFLTQRLTRSFHYQLNEQTQRLDRLKNSYYLMNPEALYSQEFLRIVHIKDQLVHYIKMFHVYNEKKLYEYQNILKQNIDNQLFNYGQRIQLSITKLDALSPLKVLNRGYTLVHKDDKMIKNAKYLQEGDIIDITFHDGHKKAEIK